MYFQNKDEVLTYIRDLENRIKKYDNKIIKLEYLIYLTMKKPIEEVAYSNVIHKWNDKTKSIKQRYKGIKRLKKNIYRFTKEIEYVKSYYL